MVSVTPKKPVEIYANELKNVPAVFIIPYSKQLKTTAPQLFTFPYDFIWFTPSVTPPTIAPVANAIELPTVTEANCSFQVPKL